MIARVQVNVEFEVTVPDNGAFEGEEVDLADLEACIKDGVDDFMFGNPDLETSGVSIQSDIVETREV